MINMEIYFPFIRLAVFSICKLYYSNCNTQINVVNKKTKHRIIILHKLDVIPPIIQKDILLINNNDKFKYIHTSISTPNIPLILQSGLTIHPPFFLESSNITNVQQSTTTTTTFLQKHVVYNIFEYNIIVHFYYHF